MRTLIVSFCLACGLNAERVRFAGADGKKISMDFYRGTDSAAVVCLAERGKAKSLHPAVSEWKRLGVAVAVLQPRDHLDVAAAIDYLEAKKGCDRSRLAVVGQGRAGAIAFRAAASAPEDFRAVVLLSTAAPGYPLDEAVARWRGTRTLALDCDDVWIQRLSRFPGFTTKGAPTDFVSGGLLDLRVPFWHEKLGVKSSPGDELESALVVYLGDVVARRRVDGVEYALIANRTNLGTWDLKALIRPARVNPDVLRTIVTFHGEIRFHLGKETFHFVVDTDDPDASDRIAVLTHRHKPKILKGKGPRGEVEARLRPWGMKPDGIALTLKRSLTSPAEIALEFRPRGKTPTRLPHGKEYFRATVQILQR